MELSCKLMASALLGRLSMKALNRFKLIIVSIFFTAVAPSLSWGKERCSFVFLNQQILQDYYYNTILADLRTSNVNLFSDLRGIDELTPMGANNDGIFSAHLPEGKVFLKAMRVPLNYSPIRFLNEVAWTKILSDLRMGPRFYGIARDPRSNFHFIVTEFVDAKKFHLYSAKSLSPEQLGKFHSAVFDLVSVGIHPEDIQFYFTSDGEVRFFDPSFFEWYRVF